MSDKFPQTSRNDISPEKYSNPDKNKGESFNEAMNAPNNPTKNHRPESYNVTDDYCSGNNSGSDD